MTKAQNWARKRNMAKFRIDGLASNLSSLLYTEDEILLKEEKERLADAFDILDLVSTRWKCHNVKSKKFFMRAKK